MEHNLTLEQRVAVIERELNFLKAQLPKNNQKSWWQKISGVFANDPAFDEISAFGQSLREQERREAQA